MHNLVYSHKVKDDLRSIADYIAQDSPIYAIKTIKSIQKTIVLLSLYPYIGKDLGSGIREIVEPKYRYRIVYEIKKETVVVLSVYKYQNHSGI